MFETIDKNKPSGAKGRYWKSFYITSTMGASVEVDFASLQDKKEDQEPLCCIVNRLVNSKRACARPKTAGCD